MNNEDIIYRLEKRAEIRRQIPGRKSVEEGKSDRIADLLEEAAAEIKQLTCKLEVNENGYKLIQKLYESSKDENEHLRDEMTKLRVLLEVERHK